MMSNFKEDILTAIGDELNTAIIIVTDDSSAAKQLFPKNLINTKQKLSDVIDYFNYKYDTGYGGQECHDFYIFTKDEVLFIHDYDGSTSIWGVPKSAKSYVDGNNTR